MSDLQKAVTWDRYFQSRPAMEPRQMRLLVRNTHSRLSRRPSVGAAEHKSYQLEFTYGANFKHRPDNARLFAKAETE